MPPVAADPRHPAHGRLVQELIKDVLDAYVDARRRQGDAVWSRDEELDEMYSSLFRELLTYMMEDPRNITAGTHLLFIAKNIERIGDHATNIAETIYYLVHGKPLQRDPAEGRRVELRRGPARTHGVPSPERRAEAQ